MDIHNYKRRFERTVERIKKAEDISKENKECMFNFKNYLLSENIGTAKIERYLFDLMKYARMLNKSFANASKNDIRRIVGEINQKDLAEETKRGFKILLRKFYRFLEGIEEKGKYPERVCWISTNIQENHKKLPEELLTEEEIKTIIEKCNNLRDRALISVLSESGCRISEIGTLKVKHISFEEYGARLTVNGKTGMRKILVINSTPYLQEWINHHTGECGDDYLWIKSNGKFLSYTRISAILKNAAKKANIRKRVYPHLLRHSRATFLASKMSEASMKQYFGWTQSSKMAATYIHMSGKDTDRAILEASGIEIEKDKSESIMKPKKCGKCKTINEVTNKYCKICGLSLDEKESQKLIENDLKRNQADEVMNNLINDPEILELIKKKIISTA
ncbi:tyrosine-type recombinase/integrase [Candidatus Woesearchaeota archaeon]|jgi:integrase/recombinase XerD|nr:tyrosine-type recombinase/integrase [Candidatus Woesearchaeota archaeon]MBT7237611.1 tyrosine-type recombinase/integrase [Candidatus Woesearchaeota archaeon]